MATPIKFEPRERFNWGYHDGASDAQRRKIAPWAGRRHYDRSYEAGYYAGQQASEDGEYNGWSETAWKAHRA